MISAVVVCLNEEKKLEICLDSVKGFAEEVVVVDLGSTDDTLKVCEKFKAKVYKFGRAEFVELVRNFAISKALGDWILILDPDETIPYTLKNKLKEITNVHYAAVNIPRKNIFFGKWIQHTNWWPDYHIRFFRKARVFWDEKIHSYPKVKGEILQLPAKPDLSIIHLGYENINQFIERQNRYSTIEAGQRFDRGERFSRVNLVWQPIREFLVRFVKHQGYLDGSLGFSLTILMCIYKLMVEVKLWELSHKKT